MLLSVTSKVLSRAILNRLRGALDEKLGEEQVGFRKGCICVDQIAPPPDHRGTVG